MKKNKHQILKNIKSMQEEKNMNNATTTTFEVPIIDLSNPNKLEIIQEISTACSTIGFFQVTSHSIPNTLIENLKQETKHFFSLPKNVKQKMRRSSSNARGYFDDEYTKQKRDWKECLDVGQPGSRLWHNGDDDDHVSNLCLDGYNQFPPNELIPDFRNTVTDYFQACEVLSHEIATYMSLGLVESLHQQRHQEHQEGKDGNGMLEEDEETNDDSIIQRLKDEHTSFLRLNHYPPLLDDTTNNDKNNDEVDDGNESALGISPHHDAGFLTLLLPDEKCYSLQVQYNNEWITLIPASPTALTINTGVMAMIYSNGYYQAPLHRVLTHTSKERYSIPFFYNPGYRMHMQPYNTTTTTAKTHTTNENENKSNNDAVVLHNVKYHPCAWGYFRCIRFAGDLMDLGLEIQIEDYEYGSKSTSDHLARQEIFLDCVDFSIPFSIERHRSWLQL